MVVYNYTIYLGVLSLDTNYKSEVNLAPTRLQKLINIFNTKLNSMVIGKVDQQHMEMNKGHLEFQR